MNKALIAELNKAGWVEGSTLCPNFKENDPSTWPTWAANQAHYPELIPTADGYHSFKKAPVMTQELTSEVWNRNGHDSLKVVISQDIKEDPYTGKAVYVVLTYTAPDGRQYWGMGEAHGGGYCKQSSAFDSAFDALFPGDWGGKPNLDGTGMSVVKRFLGELGFVLDLKDGRRKV